MLNGNIGFPGDTLDQPYPPISNTIGQTIGEETIGTDSGNLNSLTHHYSDSGSMFYKYYAFRMPEDPILKICGDNIFELFQDLKKQTTKSGTINSSDNFSFPRDHPYMKGLLEILDYFKKLNEIKKNLKDIVSEINDNLDSLKGINETVSKLALKLDPNLLSFRKKKIEETLTQLVMDNTSIKLRIKALDLTLTWINQEIQIFKKLGEVWDNDNRNNLATCKICYDNPVDRIIDDCKHAFCESCVNQLLLNDENPKCPFCQIPFNSSTKFYL